MSKAKDLTGQVFEKWTVLELSDAPGHRKWKCRCECGCVKDVQQTHLIQKKSRGCAECQVKRKNGHNQFTGYKDIHGSYFSEIKYKAKQRNYEFSVTIEYLWELFEKQEARCALSGREIYFARTNKSKRGASLDRIDNNKGYVEGNLQWVTPQINHMKNKYDQQEFISLCEDVAAMSSKEVAV